MGADCPPTTEANVVYLSLVKLAAMTTHGVTARLNISETAMAETSSPFTEHLGGSGHWHCEVIVSVCAISRGDRLISFLRPA